MRLASENRLRRPPSEEFMNDRNDQMEPKVGDQNKGLAILLAVVALLFFVLLIVGYVVGDV